MKRLNALHFLGIFALLCALAGFFTPHPEPPGFEALARKPAKLVLAQRGPVSFPGRRGMHTLGSLPGMWVFAVELDDEHRFAIDAPPEAQLRRLERLEPGSAVTALVHNGKIWQLENEAGEVLVTYEFRAAEAEQSIAGHRRVLAGFTVTGLALIAAAEMFRRWRTRVRASISV